MEKYRIKRDSIKKTDKRENCSKCNPQYCQDCYDYQQLTDKISGLQQQIRHRKKYEILAKERPMIKRLSFHNMTIDELKADLDKLLAKRKDMLENPRLWPEWIDKSK